MADQWGNGEDELEQDRLEPRACKRCGKETGPAFGLCRECIEAEDRPIKMHCDEQMRAHIEFALRRHLVELNTLIERTKKNRSLDEDRRRYQLAGIDVEIALTQRCLKEAEVAGT